MISFLFFIKMCACVFAGVSRFIQMNCRFIIPKWGEGGERGMLVIFFACRFLGLFVLVWYRKWGAIYSNRDNTVHKTVNWKTNCFAENFSLGLSAADYLKISVRLFCVTHRSMFYATNKEIIVFLFSFKLWMYKLQIIESGKCGSEFILSQLGIVSLPFFFFFLLYV